jgi:hypothetical protein
MRELGVSKSRGVKNVPVTGNEIEVPCVRTAPSDAASTNPIARIVALSTGASEDNTLDGSLVDEETGHPFIRELRVGDQFEHQLIPEGSSPQERVEG